MCIHTYGKRKLFVGKFKNKNIAIRRRMVQWLIFCYFSLFHRDFRFFKRTFHFFHNLKKIIIVYVQIRNKRNSTKKIIIKLNLIIFVIHLFLKSEIINVTKSNLSKTWTHTFNVCENVWTNSIRMSIILLIDFSNWKASFSTPFSALVYIYVIGVHFQLKMWNGFFLFFFEFRKIKIIVNLIWSPLYHSLIIILCLFFLLYFFLFLFPCTFDSNYNVTIDRAVRNITISKHIFSSILKNVINNNIRFLVKQNYF